MEGWVELAATLLSALSGGGAVHIIDYLKDQYGFEGERTFFISGVLAFIMALLASIVDGLISADGVSGDDIGLYLATVIASMERYYQHLTSQRSKESEPPK